MFCTFIFAVLLLKYCFPTGDQLERYCATDIFYSNQAAYDCYLLPSGMTEQSRRHTSGMTSQLACIVVNIEQNSFYIHKNGHINKRTNIAHITCLI